MEYFKKIFRYAKPYKNLAFLSVLFNVLYALLSTLSFVSFMPVLNVLFKETTPIYERPIFSENSDFKDFLNDYLNFFVTQQIEINGQMTVLIYFIGFTMLVFFLKNISSYVSMYFITYLRNGVLRDLRIAVYDKIIRLPVGFFSERRKGDTMARISTDVLEVQNSFLSVLELIIKDPITILTTLFAMFYISFKLTLFVLVFIPLSGLVISRLGKILKQKGLFLHQEQGNLLSLVEESLAGLKIIKTFNAEKLFSGRFRISAIKFFKYSNTINNRHNLASPMSEFFGILSIGVILWQGGYLVLVEESMNASGFLVYIGLAYNILTPAKSISSASYNIKKGNASAHRILEILEMENSIKDPEDPVNKTCFDHSITIENVSFRYEDKYVLRDFSVEIPKGKTLAIVGPSGSGKSTIANLLARFYDVEEGRIKIDGVDIKDMSVSSLRSMMGYVTQDALLFNDSIRNNILIGKPDASTAEVQHAIEVSNSEEFIIHLPKRLDTNIGDSGDKLSGGQKQRISIARAVIKNPPIMVLDEATSSLDTESEKIVQSALENLMRERTSIVIAHRLSTIKNADNIVVLESGKIVEQGTHDKLIKSKGIYKKLVDMQTIT